MDIYADRTPRTAPIARDDNVSLVSHVEADVSHISENQLNRRKGNDGQVCFPHSEFTVPTRLTCGDSGTMS